MAFSKSEYRPINTNKMIKLEIELRDGFSPADFENLKSTLTGFMVTMFKDKGYTKQPDDESLSFTISATNEPLHCNGTFLSEDEINRQAEDYLKKWNGNEVIGSNGMIYYKEPKGAKEAMQNEAYKRFNNTK